VGRINYHLMSVNLDVLEDVGHCDMITPKNTLEYELLVSYPFCKENMFTLNLGVRHYKIRVT
jgi:hypothetical protein